MRFSAYLPTDRVEVPELVSGDGIARMAASLEAAGFDACAVTDHPFPSERFLAHGGHHALDPLVTLACAASSTDRLRLHTNIYVLPYRNPFVTAKAAATLDVLSGGRLVLGVGAGYLRPEFAALGVEFEERNELFAEGLVLLRRAWTESGVVAEGLHLRARGNTMRPSPVQRPHPPIWVGGNSMWAVRQAVDHGQGWAPFQTDPVLAGSARTAVLDTAAELAGRIASLRRYARDQGRTEQLEVCFTLAPLKDGGRDLTAELRLVRNAVDEYAAAGVDWVVVQLPRCRSVNHFGELAGRFAETVIDCMG